MTALPFKYKLANMSLNSVYEISPRGIYANQPSVFAEWYAAKISLGKMADCQDF